MRFRLVPLVTTALVVGSVQLSEARPRPTEPGTQRTLVQESTLRDPGSGAGLSGATQDTAWFGGTRWDAMDGRWEAIQDSIWTFDSGVGSHFDLETPVEKCGR